MADDCGLAVNLDRIDRKILTVLQDDGRITNLDLADRVGLSPAPCLRRVRALEQSGIVARYVALLSPARMGLNFEAIVEIRLKQQTREYFEKFEKRISDMPEVLECFLTAGDWDYYIKILTIDIQSYQEFLLDRLMHQEHEIASFRTTMIMRKVKSTTRIEPRLTSI
ncbi:MAG: Lrp/AsnC family transcriptional regulator [Rhizobiaceae bacterium]